MSVSAATMICGPSGAGKSVLVATFARWVWKKFRAVTRYYSFDPGGYADEMKELIDAGIVEVWRPKSRDPDGVLLLPSETLLRAAQGWWPTQIDPETGLSQLGGQLLPPAPEWRGAVAYDGITSMQNWSMTEMGVRAAKKILGGEGSNMQTVNSGDVSLGSGNRASVGFTQTKAQDWIENSLTIRGLVTAPVWTALEQQVVDDRTRLPCYVPKIAGTARSTEVPSWVANLVSVQGPVYEGNGGTPQWRMYLRDYRYPADDSTPHKCKVRVAARKRAEVPEYLADGEGEKPLEKFNLGFLYDLLERLEKEAAQEAKEELGEVPGVKPSTIDQAAVAMKVPPQAGTPGGVAAGARVVGGGKPGAVGAPRVAPAGIRRAGATAAPAAPAAPGPVAAPAPAENPPSAELQPAQVPVVVASDPGAPSEPPTPEPQVSAAPQTPAPQAAGGEVVRRPPPGVRPPTRAPVGIKPQE